MSEHYILEDDKIVPCDMMTWAKWIGTGNKHIGNDVINGIRISTVFLGLDHSFGGSVPILFETMIFGGAEDGYQTRCATLEEAKEMHKKAVELVKNGKPHNKDDFEDSSDPLAQTHGNIPVDISDSDIDILSTDTPDAPNDTPDFSGSGGDFGGGGADGSF